MTHERYCYCEAEVRSSSVNVVCVLCLHIEFVMAALQKRGSMEPMEHPLDLPLVNIVPKISAQIASDEFYLGSDKDRFHIGALQHCKFQA